MDYENVSPETLKAWEKEYRKKCRAEMRQYLKKFPDATQEEIQDLRDRVKSGHSPYDNGDYIASESGRLMDFFSARRCLEEKYKEFLKDSEEYSGKPADCDDASDEPIPGDGLPF